MIFVFYAILIAITYQDLKERRVFWWLFLALFAFAIFGNLTQALSFDTIYNLSYLGVLAFGVLIYFMLKNGSLNLNWNEWMGLGDILFFIAITPLFPFNFFIFLIPLGFVLVLLIYLGLNLLKKQDSIPLAGLFALILLLVHIFQVPLMQWFGITQYYVA